MTLPLSLQPSRSIKGVRAQFSEQVNIAEYQTRLFGSSLFHPL
jgi:hypothetical protein